MKEDLRKHHFDFGNEPNVMMTQHQLQFGEKVIYLILYSTLK